MKRSGWVILAAAAVALAGCEHFRPLGPQYTTVAPPPAAATAPPQSAPPPETRVVRVPVKCVPDDVGTAPAYPDSDAALRDAGGAADRYQLLAAGRLLREARLKKLEDVVRHCRAAGQSASR